VSEEIDYSKIPASAGHFKQMIRDFERFRDRDVRGRPPSADTARAYNQCISWAEGIVRELIRDTKREWKPLEFEQCECCGGGPVSVRTIADTGFAVDGDATRCDGCGAVGGMSVDEETFYVTWEDEE
jgi:hypothetical protein